jgi:hypothetical protein
LKQQFSPASSVTCSGSAARSATPLSVVLHSYRPVVSPLWTASHESLALDVCAVPAAVNDATMDALGLYCPQCSRVSLRTCLFCCPSFCVVCRCPRTRSGRRPRWRAAWCASSPSRPRRRSTSSSGMAWCGCASPERSRTHRANATHSTRERLTTPVVLTVCQCHLLCVVVRRTRHCVRSSTTST